MLYMTPGISHLTRVHGAFVDDDEITRVVVSCAKTHSQTTLMAFLMLIVNQLIHMKVATVAV